jgi:prevent-host-death family protein
MSIFAVHEAKTNLSKLIERTEAGEEVIIARGDKPAVRLVPQMSAAAREPGRLGHLSPPSDDFFFAPLSDEEHKRWEARHSEAAARHSCSCLVGDQAFGGR